MGRLAPMGTPGCTGGGVGRTGALYTGRGPVCGTIMRGAGGPGAAGLGATGATGALAEIAGVAGEDETGGSVGRAGVAATGEGAAGDVAAGELTGLEGIIGGAGLCAGWGGRIILGLGGAAGGAGTGAAAGGAVVFSTAGGAATGACTTAGVAGRGVATGATVSLRCVIAFSTSPGREIFDKSIFVLISSSPRAGRVLDLPADEPSPFERRYVRTFSASCSSKELECVFFSVTPTSGSASRMALLLTSSSRARSLIRTLLIRPFVSPRFS
jgi:hypothetical protein